MTDHSRAIIGSLFSPPPGTTAQPTESFIAYLQTYESIPDSSQQKIRFLILSAARDGRLKLHKAKQNGNGTFSIGKTWALEELKVVEVLKPLEFLLQISLKPYRYSTSPPTSQQASFLVTVVRCWRRYMIGRGQEDLCLKGFAVDSPTMVGREVQRGEQRPPPNPSSSSAGIPPPGRPNPPSSSSSSSSRQPPPPPQPPSQPPLSSHQQPPPRDRDRDRAPNPNSIAEPQSQSHRDRDRDQRPTNNPPPSSSYPIPGPPPSSTTNAEIRKGSGSATSTSPAPPPSQSQAPSGPGPRERERDRNRLGAPEGGVAGGGGWRKDPPPSSSTSISTTSPGPADPHPHRPPNPRQAPPSSSSEDREKPTGLGIGLSTTTAVNANANAAQPPAAGGVTTQVGTDEVLSNVEEMLEGFEWRGGGGLSGGGEGSRGGGGGRREGTQGMGLGKGKADEIEMRLVGELKALEAASIHAIMESDDRVTGVIKLLDDGLVELERLEVMVGVYRTGLSLMTDDIAHIESQNRGLQVQTSNQRSLLSELERLMSTIHIPPTSLTSLSQESLENPLGIERLEKAAVSLYKALLSTRDTSVGDMAAASERVGEYRSCAASFCKRVADFLGVMFRFQVDQILNPDSKTKAATTTTSSSAKKTSLPSHDSMEDFLGRYCGLMLFVKEIDEKRYQTICTAYFTAMSDLHRTEIQELMSSLRGQIRKTSEDELEANFSTKESPTLRQQSMRRAGTLVRSPLEGGGAKKDNKDGKLTGSEAFGLALSQISPHLIREQGFISDFLHITPLDASITFADYMVLETFFRRGAMTYLTAQQNKLKDIRSAMETVFGWLEAELRDWIEGVLGRDSMQIVGILAALDRFILQGKEEGNEFLMRTLQKQYSRSITALERACKEQIKSIEQTKLTLKKRKGVVPFVRVFPLFVGRVETQLEGADDLNIRTVINSNYERIVATMFECLQQMAKMDGEGQGQGGEGKDQLNYHVILIENMHHIIAVFSKQKVPALVTFVAQAREKYTQNLDAYIRLILRRPLSRVLDYFQGLEQLLRTTPPTEVSLHSAYTKSALRRTLSDLRAKDLRKAVDALYKRVDKHFGDASVTNPRAEQVVVLKTVWTACEDEMQRLTGVWRGLIEKCYPDDKVGLEFGRDEVHDYFVKAQMP